MPDTRLPHLYRADREIADPAVVVEFMGEAFGAEEVDGARLRDALAWHFLSPSRTLQTWTADHMDEPVTLRYRDGGERTFPYGNLWRRLERPDPTGGGGDAPRREPGAA